jgi:hypothetical protein
MQLARRARFTANLDITMTYQSPSVAGGKLLKNFEELRPKYRAFRIRRRLRACALTIVLALTGVTVTGVTGTAFARTVYDGDWSVQLATNSGACGASYRYGVRISDGMVIYDGGMVSLQGRVTQKGSVRVNVQSGGQSANGYGRLTKNRGGGIWRGQGASGTCGGTWVAERRA